MTENDITNQLVKTIRQKKLGVAFKHNDRFTIGMPDVSITHPRGILWLEVKLIAAKKNVIRFSKTDFKLQQLATACELERQNVSACRYLVFVRTPAYRGLGFFPIGPAALLALVAANAEVEIVNQGTDDVHFESNVGPRKIWIGVGVVTVIERVIFWIEEEIR